ncbi:fibronectin type III domain-containing protein [Arthrobacter sp. KK5.5]|uniref:fibronectin type III domain-containing protein n=1 Tax=Arthrobacter sp. KK5.5 TaxID=3373084 RepID=UPI003EE4BAEF
MLHKRGSLAIAAILLGALLPGMITATPAEAAVSVSRAEVDGSDLRIEGTAIASRDISVDNVVMGRSDSSGKFRIGRASYTAPADCTVDLRDGSATVTTRSLSGCTVTQTPPTDTTPPSAPTNLTASLSGTTANLAWTASSDNVGVVGYRVVRNGTVLTGTVTGTTFANSGLAAGTYTYTVAAIDGAGNVSAASNSASVTVPPPTSDSTAPSVPANLTATLSGTTADLAWTASTDNVGVTGYRVTRNGVVITTVLNTFYNDSNRTPGTYTYTVAAVDGAGNASGPSNSASVTVPEPPGSDTTAPTAPTNLVTTIVGTTVSLSWGASTDDTRVAGYRVTRNGSLLGTTDSASFIDSGLAAGTYTYTVVAFDAAENTSAPSNSASATVQGSEELAFLTPAQMPDATVGQAYLGYIVCSDPPGPSTFKFSLVSGSVPDGTRFVRNTLENRPEARVTGTPTRAGTFTFTVEVKDNSGAQARRTFTIRVLPA